MQPRQPIRLVADSRTPLAEYGYPSRAQVARAMNRPKLWHVRLAVVAKRTLHFHRWKPWSRDVRQDDGRLLSFERCRCGKTRAVR